MAKALVYTVFELNSYVKRMLDFEHRLNKIQVRGEISNLSVTRQGHMYFTLKDDSARIRCVYFGYDPSKNIKASQSVIVTGKVSMYVAGGDYQLIVENVEYAGIGYYYEQLEKLKKKLFAEGLFDEKYKKPLVKYPKAIGLITSESGAAIGDVTKVLNDRYPYVKVYHYPVFVQGHVAASSIVNAINYFNDSQLVDTIILTRGGGSAEDLWEFNQESVARAVFECSIPIISAVGHQMDYSVCDYVADVREATPSTAAARAVEYCENIVNELYYRQELLDNAIGKVLVSAQNKVNLSYSKVSAHSPKSRLESNSQKLRYSKIRLLRSMDDLFNKYTRKLESNMSVIELLDPKLPLEKGYLIATDSNKNVIKSVESLRSYNSFTLTAFDGYTLAKTIEKEDKDE